MDLDDSDFVYVGADKPTEEIPPISNDVEKIAANVRGADRAWEEIHRFSTAQEYKKSEVSTTLDKEFTMRKNKEYIYADVKEFECKFSRKVGYASCPVKMKVHLSSLLSLH